MLVNPLIIALDEQTQRELHSELRALVDAWSLHDFASAHPHLADLYGALRDESRAERGDT